jgi:hypothetical protein
MTTAVAGKPKAEERALSVPEQATVITVSNNDDHAKGEALMTSWKELETEIHSTFDPICDKAFQAHKESVAQRNKYLDPLETGRKILKQKMMAFQDEMERLRRAEQLRLDKEAKERAEEEALLLAAQAEADGDKETADAILTAPLDVAPVMAQKTAPPASRLTAGRSVWSGEVVSLLALVKAVAAGHQPITLLMVNQPNLNSAAKLIKINGSVQHGWKVVEKRV